MAWLWWLLAPVAVSVVGAIVLWWWGTGAPRSSVWTRNSVMTEHQALLSALTRHVAEDPRYSEPVNLLLLPTAPEESETASS